MNEGEAEQFAIGPDDRHQYVRLDSAKVNVVPHAGRAAWFRLVSVPIGNGDNTYPTGDTVQEPMEANGEDTRLIDGIEREDDTSDGSFPRKQPCPASAGQRSGVLLSGGQRLPGRRRPAGRARASQLPGREARSLGPRIVTGNTLFPIPNRPCTGYWRARRRKAA
jgi:hypothetical protein